jgi:hypothetical protein
MFSKKAIIGFFVLLTSFSLASANSTSTCVTFTQNLSFGSKHSEIALLQKFLVDSGYSSVRLNGTFDWRTESAVKKFQKNNNVFPSGFFGPMTRAKMKEVGCKDINKTLSSITGVASSSPSDKTKITEGDVTKKSAPKPTLSVYANPSIIEPKTPEMNIFNTSTIRWKSSNTKECSVAVLGQGFSRVTPTQKWKSNDEQGVYVDASLLTAKVTCIGQNDEKISKEVYVRIKSKEEPYSSAKQNEPGVKRFELYMSRHLAIISYLTRDEAIAHCKLTLQNNPKKSVECMWGEEKVFGVFGEEDLKFFKDGGVDQETIKGFILSGTKTDSAISMGKNDNVVKETTPSVSIKDASLQGVKKYTLDDLRKHIANSASYGPDIPFTIQDSSDSSFANNSEYKISDTDYLVKVYKPGSSYEGYSISFFILNSEKKLEMELLNAACDPGVSFIVDNYNADSYKFDMGRVDICKNSPNSNVKNTFSSHASKEAIRALLSSRTQVGSGKIILDVAINDVDVVSNNKRMVLRKKITFNVDEKSAKRNLERGAGIETILQALKQYAVDHKGDLPAGISAAPVEICSSSVARTSCRGLADLSVITRDGQYIGAIPSEPLKTKANGAGYLVSRDDVTKRLTVSAQFPEEGFTISKTR